MSLFTPVNQKRLTNISVVRMRKNGHRYELACFPNKVKAWRDKLESNIDEVIQTHEVFANVSKGQLAKKSELFQDFETEDVKEIILKLLQEGEIPVSEMERKSISESLSRDVAKIISEKCVNTETNRPYTVTMIEKMMRECHINLQPTKSAKQQALKAIEKLVESGKYKIKPAMMEIVISLDPKIVEEVSPKILLHVHHITRQGLNSEGIFEMRAVIEQKDYHFLTGTLSEVAKNRYCVEILGAARPEQASGGKKKPPPSSPSSTVAPIPEAVSPIPEEESSEFVSNPPDVSQPSSPPPTKKPENAQARDNSNDDSENECARNAKQIEKQQKKKVNRKRKNRTQLNDEDVRS